MNPFDPNDDPWLWLEQVHGEQALQWVRERNAESRQRLEAWPGFADTRRQIRAVLDAQDRIPAVVRRGDHLYNFWQDAAQPRGVWRRCTLEQYRQPQPAWGLLLDLDALGRAEGENWVWGGATCLGPHYRRALLSLSRGGADAHVVREFDLVELGFVEGGFSLPEAKSELAWADIDTVYVGTDFGTGSLTDSGYPRVIKRWRRGQPLADAVTVFEGLPSDVAVSVSVDLTPGFERTVLRRAPDFFSSEDVLLQPGAAGQPLLPLPKPSDAQLAFWYGHALLLLRSDWTHGDTTWPRAACSGS